MSFPVDQPEFSAELDRIWTKAASTRSKPLDLAGAVIICHPTMYWEVWETLAIGRERRVDTGGEMAAFAEALRPPPLVKPDPRWPRGKVLVIGGGLWRELEPLLAEFDAKQFEATMAKLCTNRPESPDGCPDEVAA